MHRFRQPATVVVAVLALAAVAAVVVGTASLVPSQRADSAQGPNHERHDRRVTHVVSDAPYLNHLKIERKVPALRLVYFTRAVNAAKAHYLQALAANEAAAAQAARQASTRTVQTSAPVSAGGSPTPTASAGGGACGGNLPPCCVMMRESGGNPSAVNQSSGAGGKWQFMPSTWAGYGGYASAAQAPEYVQDQRAAQVWAGGAGAGAWGGGC